MKILLSLTILLNIIYSNEIWVEASQKNFNLICDSIFIDPESVISLENKVLFTIEDYHYDNHKEILNKFSLDYNPVNTKYIDTNGFKTGTYGAGYHTLDEIYSNIDYFNNEFENSQIDTIGYSIEGNPILAFTIGSKESKNGIMLNSLIHAREPGSATVILYFFYDLISKINEEDKTALQLLESTYLTWVPCVNPDGYLYNIKIFPEGGGLWRKNRAPIINNTIGVDLNRNFGPMEYWDADFGGSSTISHQQTYRGRAPFSEPETQALEFLTLNNDYKIVLNYHSFGNVIVLPNDADGGLPEDSLYYESLTSNVRKHNHYPAGIDSLTLRYKSRGTANCFFNSEDIISLLPEVGSKDYGFYANFTEDIVSQCKLNSPFIFEIWESLNSKIIFKSDSILIDEDNDSKIKIALQNIGLLKSNYLGDEINISFTENGNEKSKTFSILKENNYLGYDYVKNSGCFEIDQENISIKNYKDGTNCYQEIYFVNPKKEKQYLTYEVKYSIEPNNDFLTLEYFDNDQWQYFNVNKISGENLDYFLRNGNNVLGYNGFERYYKKEFFDISNLSSDTIKIRLRFYSDGFRSSDGISFKNIRLFYQDKFNSLDQEIQKSVFYNNQILEINDFKGEISIYDLNGNQVNKMIYSNPTFLELAVGVYFIKFANKIEKIISY
jgi:hypothetical protein